MIKGQHCSQALQVKTKQSTVTTLNGIVNVRHFIKGKGKYSGSLGKPGKQNTDINQPIDHKKFVK